MKQSHNALTYLRAQYSAIYGRAYVKGLATAMVVTSALASSMAQAATDNGTNTTDRGPQVQPPQADASAHLLSSDIDLNTLTTEQGYTATEQAADLARDISRIQQNAKVRAMFSRTATPMVTKADGDTGGDTGDTSDTDNNVDVDPYPNDPKAPNFGWRELRGKGNVQGGKTTINDYSAQTGINWYQQLELGAKADVHTDAKELYQSGSQEYNNYGLLVVGSQKDDVTSQISTATDSSITLHDNTALQINGAGGINNLNGNLVFDAQSSGSQAIVNVGMGLTEDDPSSGSLNLGGNVTVKAGSGTSAIYAPKVDLKGNITVEDNASLILNGAINEDMKSGSLNTATHSAGTFTGHGNTISLGEGSQLIVGKANNGKNTVLDLSQKSDAGADAKITGTGSLEVQGTAILSSTVLEAFVKPTDDATGNSVSGGDVTLASGGRLELSGPTDLSSYSFGKDRKEHQINILASGATNTIAGEELELKEALKYGNAATTEEFNLNLESTKLVLGDDNVDSKDIGTLGYKTAYAKDVEFHNSGSDAFHLKNGVSLDGLTKSERVNGTGTPSSGSITGGVSVEGGANNVGNSFRVIQGPYNYSGSITLNGGTLAVGALTDEEKAQNKYSNDATLNFSPNSRLVINNSGGSNTIIVAGNTKNNNATLDLTSGGADSFNIVRGNNLSTIQIGEAGTIDGTGRSEVKLTADQFNKVFNTNNESGNGVDVILAGNGVLHVPAGTGLNTDGYAKFDSDHLQKVTSGTRYETDKIYFNQGGRLEGDKLQFDSKNAPVDIGMGTIAADHLKVSISVGTLNETLNIKSGNIETSNLESDGVIKTVQIGGSGANGPAADEFAKFTLKNNANGNNIDVAIHVNGNSSGESSLNFKDGTWNIDATVSGHGITIDGANGYLNIGDATAGTSGDVTLKGLQVTNGGNINITKNSDLRLSGKNDLSSGNLSGSGDLYLTNGSDTSLNQSSLSNFFAHDKSGAQIGGRVILEGGILELNATSNSSDPINLNDYIQGSSDDNAADLIITDESTIKSNNIAVDQKLHDDWKNTLTLDADKLTLGGADDTDYSASGYSLNFKEAIAHNRVDFQPTTDTDADAAPDITDIDFYLRNKLTIDAEGNGSGDAATTHGNVHIRALANGDPTFQVLTGDVTHHTDTPDVSGKFDITGATIQIGGAAKGSDAAGRDASFSFDKHEDKNGDTVTATYGTDVTIASGSTIKVLSNGDDGRSSLDLTGAKSINTSSGAASLIQVGTSTADAIDRGNEINRNFDALGLGATDDAELTVSDAQLKQLFNLDTDGKRVAGNTNVKVVLGQTGLMNVNAADSSSAAIDVSLLASANASDATAINDLEGNKIYFNQGGRLHSNTLELTQKDATANRNLNIGSGTISADTLSLANSHTGSNFTVETGTLEVGKSLSGTKLQLGTGSNTDTARLNLGYFDAEVLSHMDETNGVLVCDDIAASNPSTDSGSINTDIALNGNAEINVNVGKWTVKDITSSGTGNKINVGFVGAGNVVPKIKTGADNNGKPTIGDDILTAELASDSLVIGSGNELNIRSNGITSTNNYANSGGKTVIDGKLIIASKTTTDSDGKTTTTRGKGDFLSGDITGTGEIEVQNSTALFTKTFVTDFTSGSSGGTITLNTGTADFRKDTNLDSVVPIGSFTFAEIDSPSAAKQSGVNFNIVSKKVDGNETIGASVIEVNKASIEESLLTNGKTTPLNLDIHANEITLGGGSGFTSDGSIFGYHQLVTKKATFNADSGSTATDAALSLKDGITFVATTKDTNGKLIESSGNSTGNLIVKGGIDDFNSFNVAAGTITHSGSLSLEGGELLIGSTAATRANLKDDYSVDGFGASLELAPDSQFKIDNTKGANAIKVLGNGSGGQSVLDLSKIGKDKFALKRGSNLTTITVGGGEQDLYSPNDALLKINSTDNLFDLTGTASGNGAAVVLTGNGALEMAGSGATLDVKNIDGINTNPTSDKIVFDDGGMIIGQDFTLTNKDDKKNKGIDLGHGVIKAEKLTFDNAFEITIPADPTVPGSAETKQKANLVLNSGKIMVDQELTSNSGVIQIGTGLPTTKEGEDTSNPSGTATPQAELHLGYFTTTSKDSNKVDSTKSGSLSSATGFVKSDILVAGNNATDPIKSIISLDDLDSGKTKDITVPSLHVDHGDWTLGNIHTADKDKGIKTGTKDVTVQNGAILEIGVLNDSGAAYQISQADGKTKDLTATLRGDELTLDHAALVIHENGSAYFNKYLQQRNGSRAILAGYAYFGGKNIGGSGDSGSSGDNKPDSSIEITGRDAMAYFGNANGAIELDSGNNSVSVGDPFDNAFVLKNGATLALEMGKDGKDDVFTLEQIQSLREQILNKDATFDDDNNTLTQTPLDDPKVPITTGYIDARNATTTAVTVTSGTIDYSQEKDNLAQITDMIFKNVSEATLTNVNDSDELNIGTVGNIKLASGTSFTAKDVDLANAAATSGNFAFNAQDGKVATAKVVSGGHLGLHNGGTIGKITLDPGILDQGDPNDATDDVLTETELLIKSASGATTNIASVSGGSGSFMGIYGQMDKPTDPDEVEGKSGSAGNVVIGSSGDAANSTIDIDTLAVNGNLKAWGKVTINKELTSDAPRYGVNTMDVNELVVNGNVSQFNQNLIVTNDARFGQTEDNVTKLSQTTNIGGNAYFTGETTFEGNSDTTIERDATFDGNTILKYGSKMTINRTAEFNGDTTLASGSEMLIKKNADFYGTTTLASGSSTTLERAATFNGETFLDGKLTAGSTTFKGKVTQGKDSVFTSSGDIIAFINTKSGESHLNGKNDFSNTGRVEFTNLGEGNKHVIGGKFTADQVNVDGYLQIVGSDAVATIDTLKGTDKDTIVQVGSDKNHEYSPSGGSGDYGTSNGVLHITNNIDLKGGTLYVDPDYDQPTALAAIENVTDGVNGNIVIGKNSAVGLGTSLNELQTAINNYQDKQTGSLRSSNDSYGAILAVNKPITVKDGQYIAVSSQENHDSLDKINKWRADNGNADFILSDNAALLVNLDTLNDGKAKSGPATAITFEKSNAKVKSEGGDIILAGDYDAAKATQIFQDADNDGVLIDGKDITIVSQSNRFIGKLAAGDNSGAVEFEYQRPNNGNNGGSDDPIEDMIEDNFNKGQNGSNNGGSSNNGYNDDLQHLAQDSVDTVGRLSRASVMGAVPQVALRAGQTTSDSILNRMNTPRNVTVDDQGVIANNNDGGLWINPVYVKSDSDGFTSQGGVTYGHDIDITGVAIGAEKYLGNNVKVGVVANAGKGSAKGKGQAHDVKNDFDYYGGGIYLGVEGDSSSVIADVSYTAVKNDLSFNESVGSYKTDADSYNLSAGVTGQATFSLGGLDVTPHLGVRYSRIHLDDINFKNSNNNALVGVNSKDINLLSVPVGVKFSTTIQSDNWTVKPSLDLTATGNFGDTDIENGVQWGKTGTVVSSEFVDKFTYGAKAGLEVSNGNFKFGIDAGYTGSKHTDEFNVGAEIRYDFQSEHVVVTKAMHCCF